MIKLLNKFFSTGLVVVLILAMFPVGAFANEETESTEPDAPTTLIVTKDLQTNVGTTLPDATFNFQLQYLDSYPVSQAIPRFPADMWVTQGDIPFTTTSAHEAHPTITGAIVSTGTSADLLAGIVWPGPGQFDFLLREEANTTTLVNTDGVQETMIYDETVFGVRVWVHRDGENLVVAGVYVFEIPTVQGDPDCDLDYDECEEEIFGAKVEARFTNTFIREVDGDEDDPEYAGLRVSKVVAGEMASETTEFTFTATLTSAAFSTREAEEYYRAVITGVPGASNHGQVIYFYPGIAQTFTLRDGQMLVFDYLPVSTGFRVVESNYAPYTPSIEVMENGVMSSINGPDTGDRTIGEGINRTAFMNTFASTPITGIIANNFPIVLVGLASAGFFAMVVVAKKRRVYE